MLLRICGWGARGSVWTASYKYLGALLHLFGVGIIKRMCELEDYTVTLVYDTTSIVGAK
jgi:hypothetical protein